MVVPCGTVTRTTPVLEIATWPQGWACGTTWVAASRCCSLARTGRCRSGRNRCGVSGPTGGRARSLAGSRQSLTSYRNPDDTGAATMTASLELASMSPVAPIAALPLPPLRRDAAVMGLVGLAHCISHFSQLLLPPLFSWLKEDFNVSYTELGVLLTVFFVVSCAVQALSGFVVDRFGPRPVLFAGIGLLALAAFGYAVSTSYAMLAAFSVVAGIGNGVFHPVDYTLLNRKVHPQRLGHAFSVHGITGSLGWALAPAMLVSITLAFELAGRAGLGRRAGPRRARRALAQPDAADDRDDERGRDRRAEARAPAPRRQLRLPVDSRGLDLLRASSSSTRSSSAASRPSRRKRRASCTTCPRAWAAMCLTFYMVASAGGMVLGGFLATDPSRSREDRRHRLRHRRGVRADRSAYAPLRADGGAGAVRLHGRRLRHRRPVARPDRQAGRAAERHRPRLRRRLLRPRHRPGGRAAGVRPADRPASAGRHLARHRHRPGPARPERVQRAAGCGGRARAGAACRASGRTAAASDDAAVPLDAGGEHLVGRPLPPVARARRSRPRCSRRSPRPRSSRGCFGDLDHAVAHHAAVVEQVAASAPASRRRGRRAAARRRRARSALRASGPTRRGRRRPRRRARRCARGSSASHRSSACSSVLTQARSAAYIGCSGSIASGMPAARAYSSVAAMPSRTSPRARGDVLGRAAPASAPGRPPTTSTRQAASERLRLVDGAAVVVERGLRGRRHRSPGTCRRGSSRTAPGRASRTQPRRCARGRWRATWSRHGEIARMPCRAQASMMLSSVPAPRRVAVLIESQRWSAEKSRIAAPASGGDAVQRQQLAHARAPRARARSSRPARSARRKTSAKCSSERALCCPPTIVKCDWWPFSQARKTTPVL